MNLPDPEESTISGFDRRQLARYLCNDLPAEEQEKIDQAVRQDAQLRAFIEAQSQERFPLSQESVMEGILKAPPLSEPRQERQHRWVGPALAMAAALALFLTVTVPKATDPSVRSRGVANITIHRADQGPSEILPTLSRLRDGDRFALGITSGEGGIISLFAGPAPETAKALWRAEFKERDERFTDPIVYNAALKYWIVIEPDRSPPPDTWRLVR